MKANHASHNSNSDEGDNDDVESGSDSGIARNSNTKSTHVSKALMSHILAYIRST